MASYWVLVGADLAQLRKDMGWNPGGTSSRLDLDIFDILDVIVTVYICMYEKWYDMLYVHYWGTWTLGSAVLLRSAR